MGGHHHGRQGTVHHIRPVWWAIQSDRWQGRQGSDNVEDRRGSGTTRAVGGIGIGVIIIAILTQLMGGDGCAVIQQQAAQQGRTQTQQTQYQAETALDNIMGMDVFFHTGRADQDEQVLDMSVEAAEEAFGEDLPDVALELLSGEFLATGKEMTDRALEILKAAIEGDDERLVKLVKNGMLEALSESAELRTHRALSIPFVDNYKS